MRTKTQTINIYTFDELSEKAKENALNDYVENFDFSFYQDDIINYFMECHKLDKSLFNYVYSGFWSQGDGGRFEFKLLYGDNLKPFVKHIFKSGSKQYKTIMYLIENKDAQITFNLNSFGYHYQHENGFYLDFYAENATNAQETLISEFCESLQDYFKELSVKLYNELRQEYEYLTAEDSFKDMCECNEYEFLSSGRMF